MLDGDPPVQLCAAALITTPAAAQQARARSRRAGLGALAGLVLMGTFLVPLADSPAQAATETLFEAEAAGNVFTGKAVVQDRPGASENKTVGYVGGGNGKIGVKIQVVDPARTALQLQYVSGEDRDVSIQCNDAAAALQDLAPSPGWSTPARYTFSCDNLVAGENTITFFNAGGPAPDIDAVAVRTAAQTLFEAEDPGNDFIGKAVVQDRPGASGGKSVGYVGGNNGQIGIKVGMETAGDKVFDLQYLSPDSGKRNVNIQCEGSAKVLLDLAVGANTTTPMRKEFSCYLHAGINTITVWNADGPAPDIDAIILKTDGSDGGETTGPGNGGGDTEDPYADDPTSAMPMSDPANGGKWTLINDYSSEFSGSDLDRGFTRFTDQWGWRAEWRWEDDAAVVRDGNLELTQSYDPTTEFNITPSKWQTTSIDVNLQNNNADTVTSYAAHTGGTGLRHTYYNQYGTRTQQSFSGLAAGPYTFSAWAKTTGAKGAVSLVAVGCDGTSAPQSTDIPRNNGAWKQYTLAVTVADGANCAVGLQSSGADFLDVAMFDDASFTTDANPAANKLANPGFEDVATTYNKSGGVQLQEPVKFGYFEVRAQSGTPFPGTCLAFWLDGREGDYSTELDMVELGQNPNQPGSVDFAKHRWPSKALGPNHQSDGGSSFMAPWNPAESMHKYGFEWGPGIQRWYVDGELKRETNDPVYDPAEQIMILSVGLRAPYVNNPGAYPNAYDNAEPSKFDYVRVWKKQSMTIDDKTTGDYQSSFVYPPEWGAANVAGALGGSVHTSTTPGSSWTMRFDGDGVAVTAPVGPGQGSVAYSIDGGVAEVVDHSAAADAFATVWTSPTVKRGKHVLTATVVGDPAARALAKPAGVDAVAVLNSGSTDYSDIAVAPAAVTFDEAAGTYTVPATQGIEYMVGDAAIPAGTHQLPDAIKVTASALEGYAVAADAVSSWSYSAQPEPTESATA
ncbi:family 16 glycosylhydrolase, partial [Arthrobacter sp.]|uniref:family 16 glycosylhydrolase n=1 Tax=Arthrobacter sp. TaxID=1667 RepID=UPI0026E085DB